MSRWLAFLCAFVLLAPAPASDTNIAFGKPVTASGAVAFPAATITDGDSATFSLPLSVPSQGFYFQVDLGQDFPLQAIYVYSRVQCCADRLSNVRMSVYADAGGVPGALNWSYDIRPDGEPNPQGGVDQLTADLAAGTFRGRFLRLTNISNTTYAPQVAEIEAYEVSKPDVRYYGPDAGNITAVAAPGKPTQATLSWNVQGYTSLSIDRGIGNVSGPLGSVVVSPQTTTTYTLTAFNGLSSITKSVTIGVDEPELEPRLSEFLASNVTGLRDSNGKHSGWIEIANPNPFAINLKDYYLTDKPANLTKWKFPSFVVPGNGYAVVFADNSNNSEPFEIPHTNFTLSPAGEYVALVARNGATVLGQFPASYPNPQEYPQQSDDHSYGISGGLEGYFAAPTPNAPNGTRNDGVVAATVSSAQRGFYNTPQSVALTCTTPGAQIRYTLDGSAPTATTGAVYSAPITIGTSTVLRYAAFKNGWVATAIDTHTYIFTSSVIASSPWAAPGIVSDPAYSPQMVAALKQVPSMSLTTGPGVNIGSGADVLASIEWIDPAGGSGVQAPCGVSLYGGAFTTFAKKSFRLAFKSEYGAPKLKYPLFAGFERGFAAATEFDYLELRNGSHDMVARGFYMSNPFTDATMLDMGSFAPHQRFVHLYLNGVYWGLFQLRERWGADMLAAYFGGDRSEYESINGNLNVGGWPDPGLAYDGTGAVWENMKSLARSGPDTYAKLRPYLDTPQYVDYMIMFMFGDSEEEYRAAGPAGPGHGFKFLLNDADGFLRTSAGNRTAMAAPGKLNGDGPGSLFSMLFKNGGTAFRRLLAQRIHRSYVSPGGALTPASNAARLTELCNAINLAIIPECARWNYRTPANWASSRDAILASWFPTRTATVLGQFRAAGFYPDPDAPVFNPAPGIVAPGTPLAMSSATPDTKIYFTTSGLDPLSIENIAYNAPLVTATSAGRYHIPASDTDGFSQTAIPNLIAYWPFNSNALDTVGGYNGTLTNGASIGGTGKFGGGALILDGTNDYVALGNPAGLQLLGQITIAAWVKPSNVTGLRNIVNKGHDTNNPNGEITLRINGGSYQGGYWAGAAGSVVPSGPASGVNSASADIGVWTHIASVWDGATWRLYRNGIEIASAPSSVGAVTVPTVGWAIGARGTGTERYFAGEIDEVRIYSRGLTPGEIGALYNNTATTAAAVWAQPATNDSSWNAATGALGFAPPGDPLAQGIVQDIGPAMRGVNASVFLRVPFTLTAQQRSETQLLRLRVRADDGYVAYLNGARIASRNAPLTLGGVSASAGETADADALAGETIDLISSIPLLQTGTNVLAVQGLNLSAGDDDFLLSAELESHRGNPGLSPGAQLYTTPIPIAKSTLIRARAYSDTTKQWSAMSEGFYQVGPDRCPPGALAISELHYNPVGDDDGEFMELINVSPNAINLQGAYFTAGVEFTFPANRVVPLAPGQRIVLVDSQLTFQKVHGWAETVGGIYSGNLNNAGERITIVSADGLTTLLDFTYSDDSPWPAGADGGGGSLVFINPGFGRDPNDPANWRVGTVPNGNPNADDTIPADLLPVIINGSQLTLFVGQPGSFKVTTNGLPAPSISLGGAALPAGITFTDSGNGTGMLSGTPQALTGGVYMLTITASNSAGVSALQMFTLTILEAPVIASANKATFITATAGAFTVVATGYPAPQISIAGNTLPPGVTFTNNGTGTASLSGTPAATSSGDYALIFTASNSQGVSAPQNFILTVNQSPAFSSVNQAVFIAGVPQQFVITASGRPVPGISISGAALPQGIAFTDNGDGTAALNGSAAAHTAGTYVLQFTAANGVNPNAVQNFALTVHEKPVLTSALTAKGTVGVPFSYQIVASNGPVSFAAASLPVGLSLNAAGLISGTPTLEATTLVELSATNPAGTGTATLSIQIAAAPVIPNITSAPSAVPNPAKVHTEVAFSCAGNAAGVTWSWDFGDGSIDTTNTSSPKHTYSAKGTYQVTATVTNIIGQSASASVSVVVTLSGLPPGVPATIVPLEVMQALALDPEDPAQSPLGLNEMERVTAFSSATVTAIKLNYKVLNKDQLALKWSMPQTNSNPTGQKVVVDLGGVVKIFTLQVKGKSILAVPVSGSKKETLKIKTKAGQWSITAALKDGAFVETLKKINGFGKTDSASPTRYPNVDFHVLYDGYLYRHVNMPLVYTLNAKAETGRGKSQ